MSYHVEVDRRAAKAIESLDPKLAIRILDQIDALRANPRPAGCRKLKGRSEPAWRVRVSDYRILYRIHDEERLVRVYGVLPRDSAYQD